MGHFHENNLRSERQNFMPQKASQKFSVKHKIDLHPTSNLCEIDPRSCRFNDELSLYIMNFRMDVES